MRRTLSIGVRWALRYTLAMAVTLAIFALVVDAQVQRRINREAHLVTEIQARELLDSLRTQSSEHSREEVLAWLAARAERAVRQADPELGLGIQYLDEHGSPLLAVGSLEEARLPLPQDVLEGRRESRFRAVNLGKRRPYLLSVSRAPGGFLLVAIDTKRFADNIEHVRDVLMLSFPITLVLTGLLGWLLARGSLSAIAEIDQTARRISGANLRQAIPTRGTGDELDQLAETLNAMMDRIRSGVERMRRFNANAAHEIRTPLTAICSEIEVTLERARHTDEYRKVLEDVLEHAHHLAHGIDAMLRLSHSEAGLDPEHVAPVPLAPLLATLVDFFEPVAEDRKLRVELSKLPEVSVRGDAAWLRQMFSNLIDNALKYCNPGNRVQVTGSLQGPWVCVEIRDNGPGMSPEELSHVFERFQRGNRHRGQPGFGLGLPIAQEIARAHGGRIEVESISGQGTTFRVWLPCLPDEESEAASLPRDQEPKRPPPTSSG